MPLVALRRAPSSGIDEFGTVIVGALVLIGGCRIGSLSGEVILAVPTKLLAVTSTLRNLPASA